MGDKSQLMSNFLKCVYDGFDTSILNFPVAAGSMNFLFEILSNKMKENRLSILVASRNGWMNNQAYADFCSLNRINGSSNGINTFQEFDNGSVIFFKEYNRVEKPIFSNSDVVVFFNVDLKRNNYYTLDMLDKTSNYDKRIFLNCNIRDGVEVVIKRKIKGEIYKKETNHDLSDLPLEIRRFKLQKIKEKYHERWNDRSLHVATK